MEKKKAAAIAALFLLTTTLCSPAVSAGSGTGAGRIAARRSREAALRQGAEAAAREILGGCELTAIRVGGLWLFTCKNGYVLIDPADGSAVEYALSLPRRGERVVLSPQENE